MITEGVIVIGGGVILLTGSLVVAVKKSIEARKVKEALLSYAAAWEHEQSTLNSALEQYARTYSLEESDKEIVNKPRSSLQKEFPRGIEHYYEKLDTIEKRKEATVRVAEKIAKLLKVEVSDVTFEQLQDGAMGFTKDVDEQHCCITLNEALLASNPKGLLETVCHEIRHCLQYNSFTNNVWHYSSQRVAQWLYSWNNYVPCQYYQLDYNGYRNQIIEVDAVLFTEEVFRNLNI